MNPIPFQELQERLDSVVEENRQLQSQVKVLTRRLQEYGGIYAWVYLKGWD